VTRRIRVVHPIAAALLTAAIFALLLRRVPLAALADALHDADYRLFLALMIPNALFYFVWDTLVLTVVIRWFHGPVRYRDLLPVRAASYVVGFFNTNLGRGALAAYLCRRLQAPFLELGSTVVFLVLTEYTQLVLWSLLGLAGFQPEVTAGVMSVAAGVALVWVLFFLYSKLDVTPTNALRWVMAPRRWMLFRTFRLATVRRYAQVVALRAPMFVVSLTLHYYAAHAFGIRIPFGQMLTFLPVVFMLAALPVTVAHLGTTQAAWVFFFSQYASAPRLIAFSLAAHVVFSLTRAALGLLWLPVAYLDVLGAEPAKPLARREAV
jgi:lysylphosphatidylglycerol synthase-like protein